MDFLNDFLAFLAVLLTILHTFTRCSLGKTQPQSCEGSKWLTAMNCLHLPSRMSMVVTQKWCKCGKRLEVKRVAMSPKISCK